jgi:ABC-type transport system involved in Fe-S cluster assembly fused permease/ATPase subunit
MINNVDPMMAKTRDKNRVSKLWMKIRSSPIMAHKLSECIELDEIVLTQVLGFVEDEKSFNNLASMKTSYEIVWQHILLCVHMFS